MRLLMFFLILIAIINAVGLGSLIVVDYYSSESDIEIQAQDYLMDVSNNNVERISSYMIERNNDVKIFLGLENFKKVFTMDGKNQSYLNEEFSGTFFDRISPFYEESNYENILFLDVDGNVLISLEANYDDLIVDKLYEKIIGNPSSSVFEVIDSKDKRSFIFLYSPYVENNKVKGFLVFQISSKKLSKILYISSNSKNLTSIYLINDEKYIFLSNDDEKIGKRIPDSINVENCLRSKNIYENNINENFALYPFSEEYKDILGDKYIGVNEYVPIISGCMLSEVSHKELFDNYPRINNYLPAVKIFVILWILGLIFISIIERMFELKRSKRK